MPTTFEADFFGFKGIHVVSNHEMVNATLDTLSLIHMNSLTYFVYHQIFSQSSLRTTTLGKYFTTVNRMCRNF